MDGFIILDLTKYNYKSLDRLATESGVDDIFTGEMLSVKKSEGIARIFIHKSTRVVIGFTTKKERNNFQMTEYGLNLLINSESFTLSSFKKETDKCLESNEEAYNSLDEILDKISKYGRGSLTKSEITFLNNYSK